MDTKSFSISFQLYPSDGDSGNYRVEVPDEDANVGKLETGIVGNDSVKTYDSKTIVQGHVEADSSRKDEIEFDTDSGTRPPGDDWWSADPEITVTLDKPSGSETLQ
ncbi:MULTISPECIES: hypothetical protein [Halobacterium]|uniref:hypothetical protein n=1 Tax=Halobacterium TaxID=2239 RepID=UPI001E2846E6|nr:MULTISPECIES: hypothetical protein [Halobacterium]WJK64875.1 hypothetical protein QSJ49_11845 [Halobacterium salinarum]